MNWIMTLIIHLAPNGLITIFLSPLFNSLRFILKHMFTKGILGILHIQSITVAIFRDNQGEWRYREGGHRI